MAPIRIMTTDIATKKQISYKFEKGKNNKTFNGNVCKTYIQIKI